MQASKVTLGNILDIHTVLFGTGFTHDELLGPPTVSSDVLDVTLRRSIHFKHRILNTPEPHCYIVAHLNACRALEALTERPSLAAAVCYEQLRVLSAGDKFTMSDRLSSDWLLHFSSAKFALLTGDLDAAKEYMRLAISRPSFLASPADIALVDRSEGELRAERFATIFESGFWNLENKAPSSDSKSGVGSSAEHALLVGRVIQQAVSALGVSTMLDIGCGDLRWMRLVAFNASVSYTGWDIVPALIRMHREHDWADAAPMAERTFEVRDAVLDSPPRVDLIMIKDVLEHLLLVDVKRALTNVWESGSRYVLLRRIDYAMTAHAFAAGTGMRSQVNTDTSNTAYALPGGGYRYLDFMAPPFNLPEPLLRLEGEASQFGPNLFDVWDMHATKLPWAD
jgi:hypothetical protein